MRRSEFELHDTIKISEFLKKQKTGVLTLADNDEFYSVPMNYAWDGERIIFHASPEGRKAPLIRAEKKGQFTVYKEYSAIPSYFSEGNNACSATQFFASVMIFGETGEILDAAQKAAALTCIMDQLQGAGSYEPLAADAAGYTQMISHTAVFFLRVKALTAKFKAGQNLSKEKAQHIIGKLIERGTALDLETAAFMQEMVQK